MCMRAWGGGVLHDRVHALQGEQRVHACIWLGGAGWGEGGASVHRVRVWNWTHMARYKRCKERPESTRRATCACVHVVGLGGVRGGGASVHQVRVWNLDVRADVHVRRKC